MPAASVWRALKLVVWSAGTVVAKSICPPPGTVSESATGPVQSAVVNSSSVAPGSPVTETCGVVSVPDGEGGVVLTMTGSAGSVESST